MDELYAMPGHLIRRAQQISTAMFSQECAADDITSVQFAALHAIGRHPGVDATRLSALIAFDRSTIGDVLDRMEQKGWIVRVAAAFDRRVKLITLTPDGKRLLRRAGTAVRRVQARLLAPLAITEQSDFIRMLAKLADVHNDVTPAPRRSVAARKETAPWSRPTASPSMPTTLPPPASPPIRR